MAIDKNGATSFFSRTSNAFHGSYSSDPDFLARLTCDPQLREDLLDLAVIEQRRHEKARPFAEYLAESPRKR